MPNFAIHDGSTVQNVIVADSQEIAEEITGLSAVETQGEPWIGWALVDGVWTAPPQPEPVPADEEPAPEPEPEPEPEPTEEPDA